MSNRSSPHVHIQPLRRGPGGNDGDDLIEPRSEKGERAMKTTSTIEKKPWVAPKLTIYGTVEEITKQVIKPKMLGTGDDFATNIVTVS
jgi:hypothetical protein